MTDALNQIASGKTLRAAINFGNRALVQKDNDGGLGGVSPALARRLAKKIGLDLAPVEFSGAGKVYDVALEDRWDVGFLAVDQKRKERVSFTRAYHTIEATYAVRRGSPFQSASEVDRSDVRILSSAGSAYALHLARTLRHASFVQKGTPQESFAAFASGPHDMVAGVRASLEGFFGSDPDVQILPGIITSVAQAMVLPGPDNLLIEVLDGFVAEALVDGFVAAELDRSA